MTLEASTITAQVWLCANGQLWRSATDEEVAAQRIYDETRTLSKYERTRPKRKSAKTYLDVVELTFVRAPLNHEPIGLADKPHLNGTQVVQVRRIDLVELIQDIPAYLKRWYAEWRESHN